MTLNKFLLILFATALKILNVSFH